MPRLSKIGAAALAAFGWTSGSAVTASYLVVAGGGGGGTDNVAGLQGGGGGAGGFLTGTASLNPTLSYTVTVGAGGSGGSSGGSGSNASNSLITGIATAIGGGGGGSYLSNAGGSGGSGGGGAPTPAGTNTAGQGNNGGTGTVSPNGGGGGGGAGAVGGSTTTPNGGVGLQNPITGSTVGQFSGGIYYLAGGGGGRNGSSPNNSGTGGLGGGGTFGGGGAGTANTGGGAGGTGGGTAGSGGSGVVIISYVGAQQFGGGVVTSSGGNTIHTFTTSGTLSPLSSLTANFLVVAGGGGGGGNQAGGGGAGGLRSSVTATGGGGSLESALTIDTNSIYLVTVGAGGAGNTSASRGTSGGNSAFLNITSTGGGGGGGTSAPSEYAGATGGSGGGGAQGSAGGAGTANQGRAGGTGNNSGNLGGGGGGGASTVGADGTSTAGGNGGAGVSVSITGSSVTYAGGGGGGTYNGGTAGTGGAGGGANGNSATAASANTGGGGGGGSNAPVVGGSSGGSGIVIISYPGSTQQMAGGTVTVAGGNVIHTFTSSGYLTPIVLVNNSLRFRGGSVNASLTRTPSVTSNRRTWTWSGWIKLGSKSDGYFPLFGADANGYPCSGISLTNFNINFFSYTPAAYDWQKVSTMVLRDYSAWYHIVAVTDTTNATAENRAIVYVNGQIVTSWSTNNNPSPNFEGYVNSSSYVTKLGRIAGFDYFDGEMAEVNFVDGLALTPNSFGTSNGLGVWQPIRYGGSYGTNGFYLPFNAGTLTYAGSFNGSNQYLTVPDSSVWAFTGNWTVEAFFYVTTTSPTYQAIVAQWVDGGGTDRAFSIAVDSSARLTAYAQYGGNQYNPVSASSTIKTNQWYHTALVVNGSTLTLYLNGVAISSATITGTINNSTAPVGIGAYGNNNWQISGGISNVRITNTAVYTSNFTVPSANLTAVSGTQLLTCQNATFVDNSTNAFTITNNNGTTITQNYPFSASRIFNDQSPQGNNWTPNNISSVSGSTLDYMTDVPTLTSATVANYATFNPLINIIGSNYSTLSNGNLTTVGNSAANNGVNYSTQTIKTGKWYAEFTCTGSSGSYPMVGIIDINQLTIAATPGYAPNSVGYIASGQKTLVNGTQYSYGNSFTTNDVIGVAIDADNGAVYFGKQTGGTGSIVWQNSGDPTSGASKTGAAYTYTGGTIEFYIAASPYQSGTGFNANFGQQPFSATPPTGFLRLNTFNLPTPTIGATASTTANKYFDATLYTGNGTSQSVVNAGGFQPDWVWIKMRSGAAGNELFDSARGANIVLFSNATNAESNSGTMSAFNSNGFTPVYQASDVSTNNNGSTFVGWQWKANGAGVSNTAGSITSTVSANTTAGFSIVTYTGNNTASTVGHGLGASPKMIIVKDRSATNPWAVYHVDLGVQKYIFLNATDAAYSNLANYWGSTAPSSTTFGIGAYGGINANSDNYVAYCFAPVAGYSAMGSYTGNGSTDGTFVFTGFRPRWLMIKRTDATQNWAIVDTSRDTFNVSNKRLFANLSDAEDTGIPNFVDLLSNGFKFRDSNVSCNASGGTYIYMAFCESPFKYSLGR